MKVGLCVGQNVFVTGVAGYGRMLRPALEALGNTVEFVPLTRRQWTLMGRPVGGYVSLWHARLAWDRPEGFDVMHALDVVTATPKTDVVTVHDFVVEDYPHWYQTTLGDKLEWRFTRRLARKVPYIQSQSEVTRHEVLKRWGRKPDEVITVYQSYNRDVYQPTKEGHALLAPDRPNFVFVGDDNPRKNLVQAVRALGELKAQTGIRARFIRVGGTRYADVNALMHSEAKRLDVDLVEAGRLPDEEVARLYSGADGYLWPSVAEGWGIPPIEAMSCGCPVVANDIPINHEVLGPLTIFHKDDAISMARALQTCLEAPPDPTALSRHANGYTWEKSARGNQAIYEMAARR